MPRTVMSNILGLIGAAIGGAVGLVAFHWILQHNFLAPFVPGGLLGIGCALLARHRSVLRGVLCAIAAILLGLYTDWKYFPFVKDESLAYYATHVHRVDSLHLLFIAIGGALAFWLGRDTFGLWGNAPGKQPAKS